MISNLEILEKVKKVLKEKFEYVEINFLEDELFGKAILNGITIEPAGETYKSVGLGGFSEKEIENISFNIHLIKKEEYNSSLENFMNDKDKIINTLYCDELLGVNGDFRSFSIETEPMKFTDAEVQFAVWIYRIKVFGKIR